LYLISTYATVHCFCVTLIDWILIVGVTSSWAVCYLKYETVDDALPTLDLYSVYNIYTDTPEVIYKI
jgi:hypothetical protein